MAPPPPISCHPASRGARTVFIAALVGYGLLTTTSVLTAGVSPTAEATGLLLLLPILALQLLHSSHGTDHAPLPRTCLTLTLQAVLTYLPLLIFEAYWATMAGYLAASLLLLLPPRVAWPLYTTVGLSMLVAPLLTGRPLLHSIHLTHTTLLTGLVLYGLARLTHLITHLHTTRGELACQAIAGERLRFARDLHDLLGFSLSAISLKSELVHQLIPTDPDGASKEIDEVVTLAGQSLTDVRKAAGGYRAISLQQEIRTAQSLLHAADIDVHTEIELATLDPRIDTALATTLREAVTNLLRHSNATHCRITALHLDGVVRLLVENDGADPAHHNAAPHSGNGLGNLHARMAAIGGRLETGHAEDGTFRLVAEAPVKPPETSAESTGVVVPAPTGGPCLS
ncbi:histidine kinase [Streptomyces sp. MnatMP-M17]|uniref:sensor histidine kinase n=1 Tax=unclassified Streptomyces TaxID=2593676 RepID=UPI00136A669F|nr:histidine kinase [Streptomyces sp. MnatMP-M17]MYZ36946.1 two-component sensor histidine kinase [Streptomyces sp. SID4917]